MTFFMFGFFCDFQVSQSTVFEMRAGDYTFDRNLLLGQMGEKGGWADPVPGEVIPIFPYPW